MLVQHQILVQVELVNQELSLVLMMASAAQQNVMKVQTFVMSLARLHVGWVEVAEAPGGPAQAELLRIHGLPIHPHKNSDRRPTEDTACLTHPTGS